MQPSGVKQIGALAALALGACGAEPPAVKYGLDACRRVDVVDPAGEIVRGAEDLAFDPARGLLYVSAYDRRGVEKAVARKASSLPEGGLYAAAIADIVAGGAVVAAPIVRSADIPGGLRPHGVSYDPATDEISFINRGYQKEGGRWRMIPRIERVGAGGAAVVGADIEARCGANDLAEGPQGMVISFDHGACGWKAAVEDALTLRRSGVVSAAGKTLFDAAAYANGVAPIAGGMIALAATREKALLILEPARGYAEESRIVTPGGPDNLTLAADGAVIAAVHPSLMKLGWHRRTGLGRAPSRIVKISPAGGAQILFDDPRGALFSAATVAVEWENRLILGSATDAGLLVCAAKG